MTTYKSKNCVVLVKTEVTKGTDPSPGTGDAVFCTEVSWDLDGDDLQNEEMHEGSQRKIGGGLGGPFVPVNLTCYLKGSGQAGPAVPHFDPLLLACRMSYSSLVYSPDWDGDSSVTIYLNWGGKRFKCTGWQGNWKIIGSVNQYWKIQFEGMGLYVAPDESAVPAVTDAEADLILCKNAAFSLGDISTALMSATEFELDYGNKVELATNVNATNGVEEVVHQDEREPSISCNPRILSTADGVNLYADRVAGDTYAFSIAADGGALNTFTIAGTCEPVTIPRGERVGKLAHEGATFRPVSNTTDGDLTITIS